VPKKKSKKESKEELPKEMQKELGALKDKLNKFSESVLEKFKEYVTGIALVPPSAEKDKKTELKEEDKEKINVLVLVDDRDSKKMSKEELKEKLQIIITEIGQGIDKKINPIVKIYTELWQSCYDANYELVELIAVSAPIYDTGILAAIKISEVHKVMLLKEFSKYVVTYALAGSIVQGKMTPKSDIDVFVVIDDTDVKRMTRTELRDKLRAIIISKGFEAANKTGIQNKLNVQVWILTEFWEGLKEANPVFFTSLRDGVPLYDRGMFMPWKYLLQMGKIKPSPEAISMYMSSGEQFLKRIKQKLKEIGSEDFFWALQTPTQGAIMLYGLQPPTPKETPEILEKIFVKKEKLVDMKFVNTLKRVLEMRKKIEHGDVDNIKGKDIDALLKDSEDYLKRLNKLYDQINLLKQKDSILTLYENTLSLTRDALKLEGYETVSENKILEYFKKSIVDKGKILDRSLRLLKDVLNSKKLYDENKLTKHEIEKIHKQGSELHKHIIEFIQRTRFREIERAKIRFKHGNKIAEMILLGETGFIIDNIEERDKLVHQVKIDDKMNIKSMKPSSIEEMDKTIADTMLPSKIFINERIFESLKKNFGDVEILINY